MAAGGLRAATIADRIAADFGVAHRDRMRRETGAAHDWLLRRSNEICGAVLPSTRDLFTAGPGPGDWRSCPLPEQRLSGCVADPTVAVAQRREAAGVLAGFRTLIAEPPELPAPSVRTIGLLMLLP
jgi:hypothetical protein